MAKAKNLVIVESPAKARTIVRYLGKDFEAISSYGHIRDLPKKELGVDVDKGFKPTYIISPDKKKTVAQLKKAAKGATIWLASDPDREGEAIAWHICHILGIDPKKTNRVVFHEFTQPAIAAAVAKPRSIDFKLVDSQQARRILDRLVGYELSPVLWKKIRAGLSAGRVQSVAVRLIVEREREIRDFPAGSAFKITAVFKTAGQDLNAELRQKIDQVTDARQFLEDIKDATFKVASISQKPGVRLPQAPFTTSTLQQEAARRLGYSVKQTMSLAQRLYENGHITYMRTDSLSLSPLATEAAKKYILKNFGSKYAEGRVYKTKSRSAQEAHEAVRPTNVNVVSAGTDAAQEKLYDLIWRRLVASQMAPAEISRTEIAISISQRPEQLVAAGEVLRFDGFIKVYGGGREDQILPDLKEGQPLELKSASALETLNRPPARYSEGSLVKKLEELGIGRPSTYAPTISTVQDRGYIERKDLPGENKEVKELLLDNRQIEEQSRQITVGADRGKLLPTQLAEIVTDFLVKYFSSIVDYDFTARAEAELDDIANGKISWQTALGRFYKDFHPLVKKSEQASRAETMQVRELGKDPASGEPVVVRYGRYGPVLQLGQTDSQDPKSPKPRFAPLPTGVSMDDVMLEQALPMFKLPREVGKTAGGELITADVGRFGPYIKVKKQFFSIKDYDPLNITESEALEVIKTHEETAKQKTIADFGKIKVLRGPYGPYVTDGQKNARIPKDQDPEALTAAESQKLLDKATKAPKSKFRRKNRQKTG